MATGKRFADQVRCCTLIGHVDHGKSSYADSLLAANNIISSRMAGQIRYLDSREDEQQRGITMEASAVSLSFKLRTHSSAEGAEAPQIQDYMINLIDTPGHVDFSSEVSSASRLCDGALVIVDVVEGVCTQTITVLRQAWQDRLKPILVINKMDRLVTELKLAPIEAYHHLTQLIEQVNAVMGSFFASERMEDDLRWHEEREQRVREKHEANSEKMVGSTGKSTTEEDVQDVYEEHDDEDIYFDPSRGNVIFASAIDNWAFRLDRFSVLYAKKLGIKESNFRKVLWGDFYLDPKTKRVLGQKQKEKEKRPLKPMFVQFVLENIWAVYDSVALNRDQEKVDKIVKALDLRLNPRDLRTKDARTLLTAIFSQWLPLAACTFSAVVSNIPSPSAAQRLRVPKMLHPDLTYFMQSDVKPRNKLEEDLFEANASADAVRVAYVSKMFAVKKNDLPEMKRRPITAEEMRQRGRESRERANQVQAALAATGASIDAGPDATPIQEAATGNGNQPGADGTAEASASQESPADGVNGEAAKDEDENSENDEEVIGFSRLYSGTLRTGQSVFAVLPKYNTGLPPSHPFNSKYIRVVKLDALYMIMGRDLVAVNEVPAGNVFGIRGLEGQVLRNATLCAPPAGAEDAPVTLAGADVAKDSLVNLAGVNMLSAPIVRVALEPINPTEMPKLVEGLRLLNQADPCVEIIVQETGEHVILTAGELHLERCLKDLRERFAKCAIQASPPLVPFRETAVKGIDMAPPKTEGAPRGTVHGSVASSLVNYTVRAVPLPSEVTNFLLANAQTLRRLQQDKRMAQDESAAGESESQDVVGQHGTSSKAVQTDQFWAQLEALLDKAGPDWKSVADKIWAFGPRRVGPNLLIDQAGLLARTLRQRTDARQQEGRPSSGLATPAANDEAAALSSDTLGGVLEAANMSLQDDGTSSAGRVPWSSRDMNESIDTGFQIATLQGPMCAEPMQGMAFFVEKVEIDKEEAMKENVRTRLSQVTGSLISSVREACKNGLLDWSPRLMMAMYSCDIQASTDVLGKVHAVLARRRGRIISEEMKEGTSFFTVGSLLPVVESFGFADEIRKRTSGAASPQLIFKGFELFDLDPFWVPRTEEELEDLGEKGDRENVAKKYMDAVRKRKGLFVSQRIVEAAEKQRTLKSN